MWFNPQQMNTMITKSTTRDKHNLDLWSNPETNMINIHQHYSSNATMNANIVGKSP